MQKNRLDELDTIECLRTSMRSEVSKMKILIENMHAGIIMLDEHGKLVMLNSWAKNIVGYEPQKNVTGRELDIKFQTLKLNTDIERCRNDAACGSIVKEIIPPFDKKSGQEEDIIIHCEIIPVRSEKKVSCIIIVLRDITREKKLEQRKSEFISIVSHELRTPLSSIKNAVNIVLKKSAGEINKNQERFLSMADRNVDRLKNIIDDLLDISKIEAGKLKINFTDVDLNQPVDMVLGSVSEDAKNKSIKLKKEIPSNLPRLNADPDRLIQILFNLIGNSIKFTPDGGEISVTAVEKKIKCPAGKDKKNKGRRKSDNSWQQSGYDSYVEIIVSDTGIGIPRDEIDTIFDKFHQVANNLKKKVKGTGLGLSIVKRLVDMHYGSIQVKSKVNRGSKFIFTIPVFSRKSALKNLLGDEIKRAKEIGVTVSLIIIKIDIEAEITADLKEEAAALFDNIAGILKNTLRRNNDKILPLSKAALSLAIVVEATKEDSCSLCKRMRDAVKNQEFIFNGKPVTPSLDIAIVAYPEDAHNENELLNKVISSI